MWKAGIPYPYYTICDCFQLSPIGVATNFVQKEVDSFIEQHPEICRTFAGRLLLEVQMAVVVLSVFVV